jgi:hypothetical protein
VTNAQPEKAHKRAEIEALPLSGLRKGEVEALRLDGLRLIRRLRSVAQSKSEDKEAKRAATIATDLIWALSVDSANFLRTVATDDEVAREYPHLRQFVSHYAKRRKVFPVLFSEMVDMAPYKRLEIGYLLKESQNPKLRSGKSVFSPYALQITRRLEFLRAEQLAKIEGAEDRFRKSRGYLSYLRDSVPNRASKTHRDLPEEEFEMRLRIHSAIPKDLDAVTKLAPLTKKTAKQWGVVSKAFFKRVFPKPEDLHSLSKAINDSDIEHESQIRAQIVERVGRAVAALARV